ncbi:hypothetical protein O181_106889, partial [Austropuccinia psidii MF-1]|nr:hypothetical protein [Austropuccinia psidii MF-1]
MGQQTIMLTTFHRNRKRSISLNLMKTPGQISRQSSAIDFTLHRGQYKILLQS